MPKLLDEFDRQIITALQEDGRLTNVDLAERIGLSPSPCLRRVKRLESEGYINGYRAVLNRSQTGLGFTAFIGVKIDVMRTIGLSHSRTPLFQCRKSSPVI